MVGAWWGARNARQGRCCESSYACSKPEFRVQSRIWEGSVPSVPVPLASRWREHRTHPSQCPICDVMPPIPRTRANCSRALQAPAQNDQTWGFLEPHLQRPWRLVWCEPPSAAEWAETPDSQAGCRPEPQSRERGLSPACPLPSRALPTGSPKGVGTRGHTCSHKRWNRTSLSTADPRLICNVSQSVLLTQSVVRTSF